MKKGRVFYEVCDINLHSNIHYVLRVILTLPLLELHCFFGLYTNMARSFIGTQWG